MFYQAALTRIQLWWCINLPENIKTVDSSTIRNKSKYIIVRTISTCKIKVSKGFDVQISMLCRGIFICATKQIHSHVGPVAPVKFLKTFVVAYTLWYLDMYSYDTHKLHLQGVYQSFCIKCDSRVTMVCCKELGILLADYKITARKLMLIYL